MTVSHRNSWTVSKFRTRCLTFRRCFRKVPLVGGNGRLTDCTAFLNIVGNSRVLVKRGYVCFTLSFLVVRQVAAAAVTVCRKRLWKQKCQRLRMWQCRWSESRLFATVCLLAYWKLYSQWVWTIEDFGDLCSQYVVTNFFAAKRIEPNNLQHPSSKKYRNYFFHLFALSSLSINHHLRNCCKSKVNYLIYLCVLLWYVLPPSLPQRHFHRSTFSSYVHSYYSNIFYRYCGWYGNTDHRIGCYGYGC